MTENHGYKVDVIETNYNTLHTEDREERLKYKYRVNLYHLIQRHCTRPAYFWYNYKWHVFDKVDDTERLSVNTEEALDRGWYFEILKELHHGNVVPQLWCDTH